MENIIITLALILLGVGAALLLGHRGVLRLAIRLLPDLILEAEERLGAGTGEAKKESVLCKLQEALPAFLRPLLTRERAEALLEEVLTALRELGVFSDGEGEV